MTNLHHSFLGMTMTRVKLPSTTSCPLTYPLFPKPVAKIRIVIIISKQKVRNRVLIDYEELVATDIYAHLIAKDKTRD